MSSVLFFSCEKEGGIENDTSYQPVEGDVFHRELTDGEGNILVYAEDIYHNFGSATDPILLPVLQKLDIKNENLTAYFNTISLDKAEVFFKIWAKYIGKDYTTERVNVINNFYTYLHLNHFDWALYANVVNLLEDKAEILILNSKIKAITRSGGTNIGDILYNELREIKAQSKASTSTRRAVKLLNSVVETGDTAIRFSSIEAATDQKVSIVDETDIFLGNYSDGTYASKHYNLKYWVLPHHHTKIEFELRANYDCRHNNLTGYFIKSSSAVTTLYDVEDKHYYADGKIVYTGLVLNTGTTDLPVFEVGGNVTTGYGNKVTQYTSHLNFSINGQTGIIEESYDDCR